MSKQELNEPELPDDYPVYGDYMYVTDGKLYRSDHHGITVAQLKRREGFKTVCRCDIFGRQDALKATPSKEAE